ncbi:glycosyltransferase family 4 protein [Thermophilibacter sp.]|uniref:glycosyltransferase family 4 protein n=1 Tax=Thermophilibacter sp. TaxID=2847309 RepID=UPI003A92865F
MTALSDNPRNILIFSALYLPHMGGVENFTAHIAAALARLGHNISVFCLDPHYDQMTRERDSAGFDVFRFPAKGLLNGRYPVSIDNKLIREIATSLNPTDVVINTRFYPHSLVGASIAQNMGIAPIVIEHGSAHLVLGNALLDLAVAEVEHLMTSLIKRTRPVFFGVSQRCCDWLHHFGIEAKGVISNAIDADAYQRNASSRSFRQELGIGERDFVVSFVGRLTPEKGVRELSQAAHAVPNAFFVVAGEGPLGEELENQGIDNLRVVGRLSPADVASLLRQSDLFCLPTRSEGFATSLLEAAACGTPSLVTDVGGARELIPDSTYGTIVPNSDPDTLAERIRQLMGQRELLLSQGKNVTRRVRELYDWKASAKSLLDACKEHSGTGRHV